MMINVISSIILLILFLSIKLMFNVAGKSIENVRNFKQVYIVTNDFKLQRLTALPSFGTLLIFNDNLAAV